MTLQQMYSKYIDRYSNSDYEWVQYISDHYSKLMDKAQTIPLDIVVHNTMRYRLNDFLRENNYPVSIAWIVLMLNKLNSENEFVNLNKLIVPDMSQLEKLKEEFNNIQSHKKSIKTQ